MSGTIQVLSEKGEVIVQKNFVSRMTYMGFLSEILERFRNHRIEITFESGFLKHN